MMSTTVQANNYTIDLVEDIISTAEAYAMALNNNGYTVRNIYTCAKNAIDAIIANPPTMALVDLQLQTENDGLYVVKILKKRHLNAVWSCSRQLKNRIYFGQHVKWVPMG